MLRFSGAMIPRRIPQLFAEQYANEPGLHQHGIRLTTYNTIFTCQAVPINALGRQAIRLDVTVKKKKINKTARMKAQDQSIELRSDSGHVQISRFRSVNCRSQRARMITMKNS